MKIIIPIAVLLLFVMIYGIGYSLNSRMKKPEKCNDLECGNCSLNCYKSKNSQGVDN